MKQYKNKIIAGVITAVVLAIVFWYGGNAPELRGWTPQPKETVVQNQEPAKEEVAESEKAVSDMPLKEENQLVTEENVTATEESKPVTEETTASAEIKQSNEEYPREQEMVINEVTGKDQYETDPVPEGKPVPVEPENTVITDEELTCTLSVRCDTVLQNLQWLDSEKVELVPKDGVIFAEQTVSFRDGESVFDLLLREMKENKIHMEFENTPIYNSAYIEGIANLYEFDLGELSGWMYKVNGWFPNYGCSRYLLKAGDKVEWVYTCDLGADVGGNYSTRNGN